MKKLLLLIATFLVAFSLTACNGGEEDQTPVVYVTLYPMEFLVTEIAGDTVEVKHVPGAASHGASVDWSAKEIIDMLDADLLFFVHAGADNYVPLNAETFEDGDVELIDMSTHIEYNMVCYQHDHDGEEHDDEEHMEDCDDAALSEDPHFWLDPVLMADAALYVKDKLIATYPENEDLYNTNYSVLSASLTQLNDDYQSMADEAVKPIITTVMLFSYWHARYDIDIISITNDAHSSEAVPGDLIEIFNEALAENIRHIMFEKNANSPAGDQLLEDLQELHPETEALYLHGLGKLSEAEIDAGETYLSIMIKNLEALNSATK